MIYCVRLKKKVTCQVQNVQLNQSYLDIWTRAFINFTSIDTQNFEQPEFICLIKVWIVFLIQKESSTKWQCWVILREKLVWFFTFVAPTQFQKLSILVLDVILWTFQTMTKRHKIQHIFFQIRRKILEFLKI